MIGGISGASGLLAARPTGATGPSKASPPSHSEADSPLLALVERDDPEAAKALRESAEDARRVIDALRRQAEGQHQSLAEIRKAAALEKIARIQQELRAMRMTGGDPEAVARRVARLSRELATAVKDYAAFGGQSMAAVGVTAGGSAAPLVGETTGSAVPGAAGQAAPTSGPAPAPAVAPPPPQGATPETPATPSETSQGATAGSGEMPDGSSATSGVASGDDRDDFLRLARQVKEELKDALREARRRMSPGAEPEEAERAEKALRQAEQALDGLAVGGAVGNIGLDLLV